MVQDFYRVLYPGRKNPPNNNKNYFYQNLGTSSFEPFILEH